MLGEFHRWLDRINATRAHPAVVTHSIDVYPIVGRVGFDLEEDHLTAIDADVMTEALNGWIAPTVDVPLGWRIPRQAVFSDNVVGGLGMKIRRFYTHISSLLLLLICVSYRSGITGKRFHRSRASAQAFNGTSSEFFVIQY